MSEWIGSAELSSLINVTQRTVSRRANKEGFQSRRRSGRGGGREYLVASLPVEWRKEVAAHRVSLAHRDKDDALKAAARRRLVVEEIDAKIAQRIAEDGLKKLAHLKGADKARADAHIAILEAADDYTRHSALSATVALTSFCAAYNEGRIDIEESVRAIVKTVSPASIYKWRDVERQKGVHALKGDYGNRKGTGLVDSQEPLFEFCVAMLTDFPHARGKQIFDAVEARFGKDSSIKIPSVRSLQRWATNFRNENRELMTALNNPDAWKNKYMTAFGDASALATHLNALWEGDATPADLKLIDGRYHIMGIIDVFPRRSMLLVTKTSTSQAVATSLRRAILSWGIPERFKTDNGSDYKSKRTRRVLDKLDIEHDISDPFSGWQKPHIERFFRTFAHGLAELLPGFIGHNVAERQAIEARTSFADRLMKKGEVIEVKMTSADLQAFCDRWLENIYHEEVHSELGMSPNMKAAGQPCRRIEDERALDLLLQPCGVATVTKKGIAHDNFHYIAPELADVVGQRVELLEDPDDLGRILVFQEGEFICIAEDPEYTGLDRRAVAIEARKRQRERVQEKRRELKQIARKERTKEIAEEILQAKELARADSNVHALPGRSEGYTNEHLQAAGEAAAALDGIDQAPVAPSVSAEALSRVREEIAQPAAPDDDEQRRANFRRWYELENSDDAPSDKDAQWKHQYESSPQFRSMHLMLEEFGPKAMGLV